jgi:hypothetical protein
MGFAVGFGTGYVLGSKAGRERYQQILEWWRRFSGSPAVQQAAERGRELAGTAGRRSLEAVQHGMQRVGSSVRGRLGSAEGNGRFGAAQGPAG